MPKHDQDNQEGIQFNKMIENARAEISCIAEAMEGDSRDTYLRTVEGVRGELRRLDRLRSRRQHVLEDCDHHDLVK